MLELIAEEVLLRNVQNLQFYINCGMYVKKIRDPEGRNNRTKTETCVKNKIFSEDEDKYLNDLILRSITA
jgi:hypothetical protein